MLNEYFKATTGSGMDNAMLLNTLQKAKETNVLLDNTVVPAIDEHGTVNSYQVIGEFLAEEMGTSDYLAWSKQFDSLSELKGSDYENYMTKYMNISDPSRTHFTSTSYGQEYEPYMEFTNNNWWDKPEKYKSLYAGFKPTRYRSSH